MSKNKTRMGRNPFEKPEKAQSQAPKSEARIFEEVIKEKTAVEKIKEMQIQVDWIELASSIQRTIKKTLFITLIVPVALMTASCASHRHQSVQRDSKNAPQILELQKNVGRQAQQIEELNKKISILATRLETTAAHQSDGVTEKGIHPQVEAKPSSTGEELIYSRALENLKSGQLGAMEKNVSLLNKGFKSSPLTEGAAFLLGEAYFKNNQFQKAATLFESLYSTSPDGPRAVNTLYLLGLTYQKLNRAHEARQALQSVVMMYPGSQQASRAAKILLSMKENSGATF